MLPLLPLLLLLLVVSLRPSLELIVRLSGALILRCSVVLRPEREAFRLVEKKEEEGGVGGATNP